MNDVVQLSRQRRLLGPIGNVEWRPSRAIRVVQIDPGLVLLLGLDVGGQLGSLPDPFFEDRIIQLGTIQRRIYLEPPVLRDERVLEEPRVQGVWISRDVTEIDGQ